jgi:hypothetical protein
MNLHELRSTPPLRDSDYAAIRARVNSRINGELCGGGRLARRLAGWLVAFATAAIVIAVFVPRKPAPLPHQPPRVVRTQQVPAARPTVSELIEPPPPSQPIRTIALHRKPRIAPANELHINLQTTDPNIRIIWIVNPKNLKEKS